MPLVSMTQLLSDACRGGYAVCYCEAWNLESLQAVLQAAEEARSPIIAGFNGSFLIHPDRSGPECLSYYAGMGLAFETCSVPVAFLLNETDDFSQIEQAILKGFNAVMVENERLGLKEYRQLVQKVVHLAHSQGIAVEAQIGRLHDGRDGVHRKGEVTDAALAQDFVEQTGIHALAVSVGNVHVLTQGKASIDLAALEKIHAAVRIPLVLHGGTGFPQELASEVMARGVAKFNFGTVLKQVYLTALREKLAEYREPSDPHPFVGMGGSQDILVAARDAMKKKIRDLLVTFGSAGKA